jgi:putative ABC transport system substrate-binding protein
MRRREFITLLGSAAAWPLAARAQQADQMQRIGVLMGYAESNVEGQAFVAAFREELLKLGWAEGRNLRSDYRWAPPGDAEATRRFAKELVTLQPNLILAHNTAATAAALEQTHIIPILFAIVADPVGSGFVTSFSRPGGNATGFTTLEPTMAGKWLELLKEIAPGVNRAALLFNPATINPGRRSLDKKTTPVAGDSFCLPVIARVTAPLGCWPFSDANCTSRFSARCRDNAYG